MKQIFLLFCLISIQSIAQKDTTKIHTDTISKVAPPKKDSTYTSSNISKSNNINIDDSESINIPPVILTAFATLIAAILGAFYKFFYDRSINRQKDELELVNKRLEEFYGPLFFQLEVTKRIYYQLLKTLKVDEINKGDDNTKLEWTKWYRDVLHPINTDIEKIIYTKSYLMTDHKIPKDIFDFVAHITSYKALIKRWEQDDYTEWFPETEFPENFPTHIANIYKELKENQVKLLEPISMFKLLFPKS